MEQDRISDIYTELDQADFTIHNYSTPDEIGTAIVHCRGKINQVSNLAVEVQRATAETRRNYKGKRKERLINYNQLMHENEEVKKGKSGLDRQAIAESLLADLDGEVNALECTLSDLKFLYDSINLRISNLNKTNSDIRLAWNIMSSSVPQVAEALREPSPISVTEEDFEGFDLAPTFNAIKEEKQEPEKIIEEPKPEKIEEPKPEKTEEPKPEKTEEPKPEKTEEPKPEKTEEPKPEKTEEPKPEKTEEQPKLEKSKTKSKSKEESTEEDFGLAEDLDLSKTFERNVGAEDIGKPVDLVKEKEPSACELMVEDSTSGDGESADIEDFLNSM